MFAAFVSHRSITHSALACAAVPSLAAVLAYPAGTSTALVVGGGLAIGYAGHVAADGCTPGGIRLWAPFTRRRVWLLPPWARIRTSSVGETAVAVVPRLRSWCSCSRETPSSSGLDVIRRRSARQRRAGAPVNGRLVTRSGH